MLSRRNPTKQKKLHHVKEIATWDELETKEITYIHELQIRQVGACWGKLGQVGQIGASWDKLGTKEITEF